MGGDAHGVVPGSDQPGRVRRQQRLQIGTHVETHPNFYPVVEKFRLSAGNALKSTVTIPLPCTMPSTDAGRAPNHAGWEDDEGQGSQLHGERADLALSVARARGVRARRCARSIQRRHEEYILEALYKAATADPIVYIVVADISPAGSMAQFRSIPRPLHQCGGGRADMIGMCAGLAFKAAGLRLHDCDVLALPALRDGAR